jgi:hypothetical protein
MNRFLMFIGLCGLVLSSNVDVVRAEPNKDPNKQGGDIWHGVWAAHWKEPTQDTDGNPTLKDVKGNLRLESRSGSDMVTGIWECDCRAHIVGFAYGYGGRFLGGPKDADQPGKEQGGSWRCNKDDRGNFFIHTDDFHSFTGWFTMGGKRYDWAGTRSNED